MRALVMLCALAGCGRLGFDERFGTLEIEVASHGFAPVVPVAGAVVWSTSVAGEIEDVQRTDATGRATLRIEVGGTVSAYDATSLWMSTFVGVDAEDRLTVRLPFFYEGCLLPRSAQGAVTIDWVDPGPAPASHELTRGCHTSIAGIGVPSMQFTSRLPRRAISCCARTTRTAT